MQNQNQNEVQVGFSVDVTELQQGLSKAELLAQQALQRLNAASEQEQPSVSSTAPGAPPPIAPPIPIPSTQAPTQPAPSTQTSETPAPIAAAWEEFRKLQSFAKNAPDVALAGLSGRGGLMGMTDEQLTEAVRKDPNFLQGKITSQNPNAAKLGARSGVDEFLERWERGRLDPRNKPRINDVLY